MLLHQTRAAIQSIEALPQDAVALAGTLFEPLTIGDADPATPASDGPRTAQHATHRGQGRATGTEHHRHELLRHGQMVTSQPVGDHQQPAREACLRAWRRLQAES